MNRPPISSNELVLFRQQFCTIQGNAPFPWQERLFQSFHGGILPSALDLPTGLGKTSVMAIWYLALKAKAPIPRRLAYVVDRRAVVDQATAVAEAIRHKSGDNLLRLSTLRGQYVDNREWLADPTAQAIVVGTVDMIGSRLLFSGYGVSAKMRPYHAGLLGVDTLIVLDEAHLVPPFEALLKAIARDTKNELRPTSEVDRALVPPCRLMSLSATGREDEELGGEPVFRLSDEDHKHGIVKRRLNAQKKLTFREIKDSKALANELAKRAWELGTKPYARVLTYCDSHTDAVAVKQILDERLEKNGRVDSKSCELLVGERRVHEREALFAWLQEHGFIGEETSEPLTPTFLVATSAGEVGVDLDADHMVCDLVEWERTVQRLGRVNRRGSKQAIVEVIAAPAVKGQKKDDAEKSIERLTRLRKPLDALNGDASPAAIVALKKNKGLKEALQLAQTPAPLRPALTRALVDAWSMTSIENHTGRPNIQPWLRGWVEDEAQATIVWRKYLPERADGAALTKKDINDFFEAAPPQTSETLESETWRVTNWLIARAKRATAKPAVGIGILSWEKPVLFILDYKHQLAGEPWTLGQLAGLAEKEKKREREAFQRTLTDCTLVVLALLAGLNGDGMLDENFDGAPSTLDHDETWRPLRPFRVRETTDAHPVPDADWHESHRLPIERTEDDETRWILVEQRRNQGQSEESRAIARYEQKLADHQSAATRIARRFAEVLALPPAYSDMITIAAKLHDEGKRAARWQRSFNAPGNDVYAKTNGPINFRLLDGYRHEFGSLTYLEKYSGFQELPADLRDLMQHIIASHHGGARPLISTRSCEDAPPSVLEQRARDVALRFARLQKRWGPWGLAWWEALLRAADQRASRENAKDDLTGGSCESERPADG